MPIAVLYPRFHHPAIEERYASWQSQFLLHRAGQSVEFRTYDAGAPAADAAGAVESDTVLVITDPLVVTREGIADRLQLLLEREEAAAALPVSNEAQHAQQRRPLGPYLTLRELETVMDAARAEAPASQRIAWDHSDPAVYLCRTAMLDKVERPLRAALAGQDVIISANEYVHRWSAFRGQARLDLLDHISTDAKSILEIGCGEGALGEALKRRQRCRVVGVEIDAPAAAVARKRMDDVYCGDVQEILSVVAEEFDFIVGSEIIEHVDDPWSLLADIRRVCRPGGHLLLSVPNIAHASIIGDLLHGRFDYAYIGLTCAGHVRFFTRRSLEELMAITGWTNLNIVPQFLPSPHTDALLDALAKTSIPISRDDLAATGYYVVAQNAR